jgi:hypothetical protein
MTEALRHHCRYDRAKLSEPTDNPRRAFCCRGCFNRFYRPELHYMRGPGPEWREKHRHGAKP